MNRSASFRSDRKSNPDTARGATESLPRSVVEDNHTASAERHGTFYHRASRQRDVDAVSDTSSQADRRYAALLGPDFDDMNSPSRVNNGPMNIGKRLYVAGMDRMQRRDERLQSVREQILLREMSDMTKRPAITRAARQRPSKGALFAEHARLWIEKKKDHIQDLKQKMERDEVMEVRPSPSIDRRSLRMIEESEDYVGPVTGWESRFAHYSTKKAIASSLTPRDTFQPVINRNARRPDEDKPISDRLFEESHTRVERREELEREVHEQQLVDPNTGRRLFSPQPMKHNGPRRSPEAVTQHLVDEGERLREKKKRLQEKLATNDGSLTFKPAINPKSSEMAEKAVRQPLHTPIQRKVPPTAAAETSNVSSEAKPPKYSDPEAFLRRNEAAEQQRHQRLKQVTDMLREEEAKSCSFQPRISRRSVELVEAQQQYGAPDVDLFSPAPTSSRKPQQSAPRHGMAAIALPQQSAMRQPSPHDSSDAVHTGRQLRFSTSESVPQPSSVTTPRTGRAVVLSPEPTHAVVSPTVRAAPQPQYNSAASPLPIASPLPQVPKVDAYLSNFEQQMFAVLEEWRQMEDTV